MALHQEPLTASIERGDRTVRFEADGGEENGPYDPAAFSIERDGQSIPADGMTVEGKTITVRFPVELIKGDGVAA